jgi:hypothetical protein
MRTEAARRHQAHVHPHQRQFPVRDRFRGIVPRGRSAGEGDRRRLRGLSDVGEEAFEWSGLGTKATTLATSTLGCIATVVARSADVSLGSRTDPSAASRPGLQCGKIGGRQVSET